MATRAVHIDVVEYYSSEAFIAAFHRFTARRGHCKELYSDQGTNFVEADALLRQMVDASLLLKKERHGLQSSQCTPFWRHLGSRS